MRKWLVPAAVAALAAGCGGGGGGTAGDVLRIDPALLALVPADTLTLAGGRWDLLQKSPLYAKLEPMLPGDGPGGLRERLGVDPGKDLREFLFAHDGKAGLALARVTFNSQELADRLVKEGAERSDYKGKTVLGRGQAGLALVSDGVVAAGPMKLLHAAIDRAVSGAKPALPERLARSLASLPSAAQFYFTGAGGATLNLPRGSNLGNIDKVLASLDSVTGFADLSKGVRVAATGQCTDAEAAKRLHTQMRGLIGMGRLSTPDNQPELLKLFDAIETKLDEKAIQLNVNLSVEQAEQAIGAVRKLRP